VLAHTDALRHGALRGFELPLAQPFSTALDLPAID